MCAARSELVHLGDDILYLAEVDEGTSEGLDELTVLTAAVNSDYTSSVGETVLDSVLS